MKKIFTFLLSPLVALIFCSCDGLDSKSSSELLQNAYSLTAERKFDKAIKYSRAVLERRPDNVDALLLLSIASEGNQDRAVALEAAQKAERIAPENFAVQYLLGRLYSETPGKEQDAVVHLGRARRLRPNDRNAMILMADVSVRANSPGASEIYKNLRQIPEIYNNPRMYTLFGKYFAGNGNQREATQCYTMAYKCRPAGTEGLPMILNLARFADYYLGGQFKSVAISRYQEYLAVTKQMPELAAVRKEIEERLQLLRR